jgi:hypothetical protein
MERANRWLWRRMPEFAGIGKMRWTTWEPPGFPAELPGPRTVAIVLGQQRHFQHLDRIDCLLRDIELLAGIQDQDAWRYQRKFFRQLLRTYFDDCDLPGWVQVNPMRPGFRQRIANGRGKVSHKAQLGQRQFRCKNLGQEWLTIHGRAVHTGGLLMFHRGGVLEPDLELRQMHLHRELSNDGLGPPVYAREEWLFLVSRDSAERRLALRGLNPSVECFRDDVSGANFAPIISLCRVNATWRQIELLAINLRPEVGEVLDLRPMQYDFEFYFRSHMTNHTMMERLLIPGEHERWQHG